MPRPRFEEEPQRRRNITLSDRLAEIAKALGEGNISVGIRRCLEGKIHTEPKPQAKPMGKKKASNIHTLPEIEAYKAQLREQFEREQVAAWRHLTEAKQAFLQKMATPELAFTWDDLRRLKRLSHPDAHPDAGNTRKRQCDLAMHSLQEYEKAVLAVLEFLPISEARELGWETKHPYYKQSQAAKARHKAKQKGQGK